MLVCSVSQLARRAGIAADVAEAAAAADAPGSGNVVFAALVDDPASVRDVVDAYSGQIMVEAANAHDSVSIPSSYTVAVAETVTAASSQDATRVAALTKTWNPADLVNTTLSNANLTATSQASSGGVRATCSVSAGKVYWEVTLATITNSSTVTGCARTTANLANMAGLGTNNAAVLFGNGIININAGFAGSLAVPVSGSVIGIAVDFGAAKIWFRIAPSGNWNGSGTADPATGAGGFSISAIAGGALYPNFSTSSTAGEVIIGNFGGSAFTGSVPSGFSAGF
jgi:hypothetical protein